MTVEVVGKATVKCPVCGKIHDLEERERHIGHGEMSYTQRYFFCHNSSREILPSQLSKQNLDSIKSAYERDKEDEDFYILLRKDKENSRRYVFD